MIVRRRGRVEIFDTDASGLIFFGATTRWMADGEQDLLDAIGMSFEMVNVAEDSTQGGASAPTRSYEVSIDARMGYLDEFDHELWVSRVGRTSYTISHRMLVDGVVCVQGSIHRVFVEFRPGEGMVPVAVPDVIRRAVTDGPGALAARDRGPGRGLEHTEGPIVRRKDRVGIYDTDASGLIFYGAPTHWMTVGDLELLRAMELNIPTLRNGMGSGAASAPIRRFTVHIDAPMWFRDEYEQISWVGWVGGTSYTTNHEFRRDGAVCVRAEMLRVNVLADENGALTPQPLPDQVLRSRSAGPA